MKESFILLLSALVTLTTLLSVALIDPKVISYFVREDGIVENLSALFYLLGFLVCLYTILKFKRQGEQLNYRYLCFWTFVCFFCFGEETSWLQRVFNYSVPAVESLNIQGEFNFHNLRLHESHASGKREWTDIFTAQYAFRFFIFCIFLFIPLLTRLRPICNDFLLQIQYPMPSRNFMITFWTLLAASFVLAVAFAAEDSRAPLAETRELLYAYFIFLYLLLFVTKPLEYRH